MKLTGNETLVVLFGNSPQELIDQVNSLEKPVTVVHMARYGVREMAYIAIPIKPTNKNLKG